MLQYTPKSNNNLNSHHHTQKAPAAAGGPDARAAWVERAWDGAEHSDRADEFLAGGKVSLWCQTGE